MSAHPAVTGRYVNSLPEHLIRRMEKARVPWGDIGYVVYKRTHARHLDGNDGPKEEYWQTQVRCIQGLLEIGLAVTPGELETLAEYLMMLKCNFSGRGLWQLGTKMVDRIGG